MAQGPIHSDQTRAQRHFIEEIEMAIRASNREILGNKLPHLDKQGFYRLAVSVARLRAEYLEAVLAMNWEDETADFSSLRLKREKYEEATAAFEALERTIERGYVDIPPDKSES